MKKISLFLFTLCVSVASVFAGLNPFVYDLSTSWNQETKVLNVQFRLNAEPNFDSTQGVRGVQIYLVDSSNKDYYIKGPSQAQLQEMSRKDGKLLPPPYTYSFNIDLSSGMTIDATPKKIPVNQPLRVAVVVSGVSNSKSPNRQPEASTLWEGYDRLYSVHGITIDTVKTSPTFGRVFATEGKTHTNSNYISKDKGVGVYKFNPGLKYEANWKGGTNSEPIRVRLSEDGRLFVCSFTNAASSDVWEINKSTGKWTSFISRHSSYGDVIGIDTKGKGNDLKILLCYLNKTKPSLDIYEYSQKDGSITYLTGQNITTDEKTYLIDNWTASIAYGNQENDIWLSYEHNYQKPSQLKNIRKINGTWTSTKYDPILENTNSGNNTTGGAAGILVHGNLLIKAAVRSSDNKTFLHFWTISTDNTTGKAVLTKKYNPLQVFAPLTSGGYCVWINDMAIDHVNNVYMTTAWYARLNIAALPYSGSDRLETRNTFEYTTPVPNILANDLRCTPHATQNKYIFSFNVNTKPEVAQLRFYDSYEDMKKSLNEKNADKYQGTNNNKPAFVYNIPKDKLKQGRIEVVLGGVAGQVTDGVITNDRLPAGVLYWSVYVKTRTSHSFAPVYTQPLTGKHAHNRLHATVNNYPETDNFGYIYAPDYATNNVCKLMVYSIGDGNVDDEDRTQITSTTRYDLVQNLDISQVVNTRRPAVAPDGSVFLADFGASTDKITTQGPAGFDQGGVWVFNPNLLQNKSTSGSASVTRFHSANETSSGVCFYGTGNSLKLYKTNTYDEIARFPDAYNESARLTNGYRIFNVGNSDGTIKYTMNLTDGTEVAIKTQSTGYGTTLKDVGGDANGNISIKVVSDGVWLCQHRSGTAHVNPTAKNPNPDSFEATALMFQNNNGKRAFSSFEATVNGASLSQTGTSIMQSTPGAGMTVSSDEKYLYVVNHEGNILEFQIGGTSNAKTLTHTRTLVNTTQYKTISTLNFDYVGNLVASTDKSYPDMETQIVVFTMPREQRTNACEIQAPNSCRMIPERVAQLDMDEEYLAEVIADHQYDHPDGCAVDLYRPLQGKMFNTICLPFDLNLDELPNDHPLKNAVAKKFTGLSIDDIVGEKILSLVFTDLNNNEDKNTLIANVPYIIQPRDEGIRSIVRFDGPIKLTGVHVYDQEREIIYSGTDYNVTFHGIVPYQDVAPNIVDGVYLTLMLVADNRLAAMTSSGQMLGFRGYFDLNKALPQGIKARITTDKKTPTNTTIVVDGQKVNVEKFLREGRVYIRVGEALYTITGEKVE